MQEPTVYEKTLSLSNPTHPLERLLTSVFLYSADYYPLNNKWLHTILHNQPLIANATPTLLKVLDQLMQMVARQIVHGPSGSYVATYDRPHNQYLDSNFIMEDSSNDDINLHIFIEQIRKFNLDKMIPEDRVEELLWYDYSKFMRLQRFLNKKLKVQTLRELQSDGENWNRSTPVPTLLLTLEYSLSLLIQNLGQKAPLKLYLFSGRVHFLHNKILNFPTKTLCQKVLSPYRYYIKAINKDQSEAGSLDNYVGLILQYASVLVFYYKYRECQNILQFAKNLVNLEIEFTGKMGRRTKYQSFDTPQLIMNIKHKQKDGMKEQKDLMKENEKNEQEEVDKDAPPIPDARQLVLKELDTDSVQKKTAEIDLAAYDQENILLQAPKLLDETQIEKASFNKVLVTLGNIQYMWDSTPKDQILFQQISTSMQTLLHNKDTLSYPVLFNILLLRSLNQFPRIKNAERALEQFEKLKNNYNLKTEKDMEFLYATAYYPQMDYIKLLAGKYMELGMVMTAVQLYQAVGMKEECIDGLISRSYKEKASALAEQCLKETGKTPRLLCMMADLKNDDSCIPMYEEAWELSGNRNPRPMRSLAWHYFRAKKFDKAAECFKKATEANHYHPNTWFTLGCCYMQMNQYSKALPCFSECICIDDTQGQAWGNMSTCYIYLAKWKQAYSTLEQATKFSQKNWKLWSNMLSVSLKLKKFYKYFECVQRLVNLERNELLTFEMLNKINLIFQYQQDNSERRRPINTMKNRIDRIYTLLVQKIGQNPIVWKAIHEFNLELDNFVTCNYKHYKKLHQEGSIEPNDLIQGYETLQSTKTNSNKDLNTIRHNLVESKQTELNMTMKAGWELRKDTSEQVAVLLKEYIAVFNKYIPTKGQQDVKEFKLFVNGVRDKIEKCLQRKIDFEGLG